MRGLGYKQQGFHFIQQLKWIIVHIELILKLNSASDHSHLLKINKENDEPLIQGTQLCPILKILTSTN
jgi:hypothetical protein